MRTHSFPLRPISRYRPLTLVVIAALLFGLEVPRILQAGQPVASPHPIAAGRQIADSPDSQPDLLDRGVPASSPEAVQTEDPLSLVQKVRPTVETDRAAIGPRSSLLALPIGPVCWSSPPGSPPPLQILLCTWRA
jgi:hypothetical protein